MAVLDDLRGDEIRNIIMITFGMLPEKELRSIQILEDGEPDFASIKPSIAIPLVKHAKPPDTSTHTHEPVLVWFDDRVERDWQIREITIEEKAKSLAANLPIARAGMSGLIATLPVESRARFADARAGVEKLLDIGDLEAALYRLNQIATDTDDEAAVKATLVATLAQFIPAP